MMIFPPEMPALSARQMSLADAVYETLIEAIVSGRLATGAALNAAVLARQLQVSRTPVLGAIRRLENDGLAIQQPGRKARVVADAYPGQTFEGIIFYVSPRAEFTPRNVQTREDRERLVYSVEVRVPNADMRLRAGMPVEVAIEGSWQ